MKALTVYQPWASLLATGAKRIETRPWATKYRGPLAIHAGKRFIGPWACELSGGFRDAAVEVFWPGLKDWTGITDSWEELPRGKVIAIADLVDCVRMVSRRTQIVTGKVIESTLENGQIITGDELAFGDYTPGRYAWILANVRQIEPVPAKGMQRLWEWDGVPL